MRRDLRARSLFLDNVKKYVYHGSSHGMEWRRKVAPGTKGKREENGVRHGEDSKGGKGIDRFCCIFLGFLFVALQASCK